MAVCPRCQGEHPDVGASCPNDDYHFVPEDALEEARHDPLIGSLLADKYVILGRLASGGMGTVHRGLQLPVEREVAVKILHAEVERTDTGRKRFEREARAISRLSHPNIITLYDFGFDHRQRPFMVMELVSGRPLSEWMKSTEPTAAHLVHVGSQILSALSEAHERDIVHRDLKPANILITRAGHDDDFVKLLDFGLARFIDQKRSRQLTRDDEVFGTPHYMSPEQARGDSAIGARSDVYSMGVLLYWLFSGRVPFDADQPLQVLFKHLHDDIPPLEPRVGLESAGDVEDVIHRAMNKEPSTRFEDADEMFDAFEEAVAAAGLSQTPRRSRRSPTPRGVDVASSAADNGPADRRTVRITGDAETESDPPQPSSSDFDETRRQFVDDANPGADSPPDRQTQRIEDDNAASKQDPGDFNQTIDRYGRSTDDEVPPTEETPRDDSTSPGLSVSTGLLLFVGAALLAAGGVTVGLTIADRPAEPHQDDNTSMEVSEEARAETNDRARSEASDEARARAVFVDETARHTAPDRPRAQRDERRNNPASTGSASGESAPEAGGDPPTDEPSPDPPSQIDEDDEPTDEAPQQDPESDPELEPFERRATDGEADEPTAEARETDQTSETDSAPETDDADSQSDEPQPFDRANDR